MAGRLAKKLMERGESPPEHNSEEWFALVKEFGVSYGRNVCGAKARSGWPCEHAPARGRNRCRQHGGATAPAGPTHHNFRNGRYSKILGGRPIGEMYEEARNDPKLLALREEIAVLVAKQQETLDRLDTRSSQAFHELLGELYAVVQDAHRRGADGELASALDALGRLIRDGLGEHHIWHEYTERTEQIRKLVDTERKYQEGLRLYLPVERAVAIQSVWLDCMKRTIPQEYLIKFHAELRRARDADTLSLAPPMRGRDVSALTPR